MFCSFARAASSIPCGNRQVREGNDELLLTSLETLTAQLETWKIQEKDLLLNRAGNRFKRNKPTELPYFCTWTSHKLNITIYKLPNIKVLDYFIPRIEPWTKIKLDILDIILGIQDVNDEQKNVLTICSAHRFELAKHWRPSTACCHPEHTQSTQKRKVSIPDRYITPDMAKEIMLMYGLHCIIGSRKCFK